jgi:hypothetical protein
MIVVDRSADLRITMANRTGVNPLTKQKITVRMSPEDDVMGTIGAPNYFGLPGIYKSQDMVTLEVLAFFGPKG